LDGDREHETAAVDLVGLFREHAGGLAGVVRAVLGPLCDAQEVLQEAFLRAWQGRERLRAARDPKAWVFVLTMNLARDLRRHARRRESTSALTETKAMELSTREPGPHELLLGREALGRARVAIAALAEEDKEVFLLRTSAGLSFEGIATALGIPVGTAKTRMRRALHRLRRELAASDPDMREIEIDGGAR
jgi:RNA polymerase sigma-70 factor (ECF subfamily)